MATKRGSEPFGFRLITPRELVQSLRHPPPRLYEGLGGSIDEFGLGPRTVEPMSISSRLTNAQWRVLAVIPASDRTPAMTQATLAEKLARQGEFTSAATVSRAVKRFRELKLIEPHKLRRTSDGDKRSRAEC